MKHYKSVECLLNLNVKPRQHKRQTPPHKRKDPLVTTFWRRFCKVPPSLFAAQRSDFTFLWVSASSFSEAWNKKLHQDIWLVWKTSHLLQVVHTFRGKNYTDCRVTIETNFMFNRIITANIQKALNTTDAGTKHTYVVSKHEVMYKQYFPQCSTLWLCPANAKARSDWSLTQPLAFSCGLGGENGSFEMAASRTLIAKERRTIYVQLWNYLCGLVVCSKTSRYALQLFYSYFLQRATSQQGHQYR